MTSLFDQPTAIRPGEEVDTARLEEYLHSHLVDEKGPLEVRQYPSGHSNLTYALASVAGSWCCVVLPSEAR